MVVVFRLNGMDLLLKSKEFDRCFDRLAPNIASPNINQSFLF